jgi:murein L,D-transpeptidase YcbB/YkuD
MTVAQLSHFVAFLLLALMVGGCGATPSTRLAAPGVTLLRHPVVPPSPSVATRIQGLLDSAKAGQAPAADAQRGLQAGATVRAFYGKACAPVWTQVGDSLNPNARAALTLLARAAEYGLRPADYGALRLGALRDSLAHPAAPEVPGACARQQAELEVYLSDAVLTFMRDLNRGRLHPYTASARERVGGTVARPVAALQAALASATVPAAMLAGQPANREYHQLQQALARWLAVPTPPDSAFQHQARFEQAALNLERWRWEPALAGPEYVLINIPAYELQVVAHDSVLRRHRVVVGAPQTPTPTLSSAISHFTLAPDWHVPRSIAVKEMLPHLKKDAGYLARNNYAVYDSRGRLLNAAGIKWAAVTAKSFCYTIRQSAGCENALGNIVFRFANPYSVYLHDTPLRQFFARPYRALSHGCIRLEQPLELAAYLLRREGRPVQLPSEDECARQPRPHDVRLGRALPLYIRYATCTAEHGRLVFLPDIYGRDETLRRALFGPKAVTAR